MRQEQYEEAKRRIANFDSNWVREVAIGDIEYDSKSSQVRVKGHATQNVAAYAEVLNRGLGVSSNNNPTATKRQT